MSPVSFENSLVLKNVSYRYSFSNANSLNDVSLDIKKGEKIGFVGTTGSGKSTLLDIIMGLLHPVEGHLEVDGKIITSSNVNGWQSNIAHVPQSIFLIDGSIAENIAFGTPYRDIDHGRVKWAAEKAQISDVIEGWPNNYATSVGERGIRLSGGQRQRIGIARALYKKACVFVFDEATSALDSTTEQMVMETLNELADGVTILIVAHRVSTLKGCKRIVEIEMGSIRKISDYATIQSQTQKNKMKKVNLKSC